MKKKGFPRTEEISMSKWLASELSVQVSAEAIKVFGTYGCTEDYPLEHHYLDAILPPPILAGSYEMHKLIVGQETLGIDAII